MNAALFIVASVTVDRYSLPELEQKKLDVGTRPTIKKGPFETQAADRSRPRLILGSGLPYYKK